MHACTLLGSIVVKNTHSLQLITTQFLYFQCTTWQNHNITLSTQLDPFAQGLRTHSFSSTSQFFPVKPGLQMHLKPPSLSTQVASLLQGLEAHSRISRNRNGYAMYSKSISGDWFGCICALQTMTSQPFSMLLSKYPSLVKARRFHSSVRDVLIVVVVK